MDNSKMLEFEQLFKKRAEEQELANKRENELRGDIRASLRQNKERAELIDKRILDFYEIKLPDLNENTSVEQLEELESQLKNMLDAILGVSIEFLRTNNIGLLTKLPKLTDNSSLAEDLIGSIDATYKNKLIEQEPLETTNETNSRVTDSLRDIL